LTGIAASAGGAGGGTARGQREIGPIGTASRVAGGLIAIIVPIAFEGIGWWDLGAALVMFPLIATAVVALLGAGAGRLAPRSLGRADAISFAQSCALICLLIAIPIGMTFVTPADAVAVWTWVGASLLLAAARGQGGCELLASPNAIAGRRDRIGCFLFTPIDAAEARRAELNHGSARRSG
jgi:hypothetical protein